MPTNRMRAPEDRISSVTVSSSSGVKRTKRRCDLAHYPHPGVAPLQDANERLQQVGRATVQPDRYAFPRGSLHHVRRQVRPPNLGRVSDPQASQRPNQRSSVRRNQVSPVYHPLKRRASQRPPWPCARSPRTRTPSAHRAPIAPRAGKRPRRRWRLPACRARAAKPGSSRHFLALQGGLVDLHQRQVIALRGVLCLELGPGLLTHTS